MNPAEAIQEDHEFRNGVDVDHACSDCGDAVIVRYIHGEPVDESALSCHCGGELEAI